MRHERCRAILRFIAAAILVAMPVLAGIAPRAAAGEPGDTHFLEVRIDRVTPEIVTTTSDATVTVNGTQATSLTSRSWSESSPPRNRSR